MQGAHSERRRLLEKLLRELVRAEGLAVEHASAVARRIGETAPVDVLRDVRLHALSMRSRFVRALEGHSLSASRGGVAATLSTLRCFVAERVHDPERAYRGALLDLRHGVDVVRVLREVARLEELFALIRWCDDWLTARRTLVARVEAQLPWFTQLPLEPPPLAPEEPIEDSNNSDAENPPVFRDRP